MLRRLSPRFAMGLAASLALSLLAGCALPGGHITPRQAIVAAADAAPAAVSGVFKMRVRAVGRSQDRVILNSEADYRDQRNLSVVLSPAVAQAIEAKSHQSAEAYFQGHELLVSGEAKRVTIWFFADGQQTDKYYYQTHVDVTDPAKLTVTD